MAWLNKILVPLDFSQRSPGVARYAISLARHLHSGIILLHVRHTAHYEFAALEGGLAAGEFYAAWSAQLQKELETFLADEFHELPVERVMLEGDPARKIVDYAHEEKIDLIVMPTHGYGPFRRFILGSVTAKILHDADCPVWTGVHLEEAPSVEATPIRNVVCAVDLGLQSLAALDWANKMAGSFNAKLILAHAAPFPEAVGAAREDIDKLQQSAGTQAEVFIESGDAPVVVRGITEGCHGDLLVIGRSSATGVFGRLRTNAYTIIRESPCPVVSV